MRDRLIAIFNRQRELMEKYEHVESDNGLLLTSEVPVNLNCRFGQARLKDFAWRMTEELGEALSCCHRTMIEEYNEELVDALHFLTEFTILAGVEPHELLTSSSPLPDEVDLLDALYGENQAPFVHMPRRSYEDLCFYAMKVIQSMSMACNLLKNRPWKTSRTDTDRQAFLRELKSTWERFICLCRRSGIESNLLYLLYMGKASINQDRQEAGY